MRLKGARVLVVEDESIVAMLVEDMLADEGAEVVGPAATVAQAMGLLAGEAIDIGFLDVNLNGERSHPIAAELQRRGIPVVFATGYDQSGMEDTLSAPTVQKPYFAEQVATTLVSALGQTPQPGTSAN